MEERLQKIMAHAGVASRRACEEIIVDGRVKVNGKVVTELGTRVDPDKDTVLLDGRPLTGSEALRYIVLYKPAGYLSDTESTDGRPCLVDLVKVPQRLYPVGRLDFDSEGLMLLTNDGNLAHRLTHPRYEHPKEYLVLVEGKPGPIALRKLRQGIELSGGKTAPAEAEIVDGPPPYLARSSDARSQPTSWLRMVLREGRKREIRHMTAVVGHPVLRLIRVGLGPLRLVHLEVGAWRDATLTELRHLRRVLQDKPAAHGTHLAVVPGRSQRSGPRRAQPAPRPAHGRPPRRPAPDRTDLSADTADAPRRDASADAARPPRHTEGAEAADAPRRDASARPGRRADATRRPRRSDTARPPQRTEIAEAADAPRRDASARPGRPANAARRPRRSDTARPPRRAEGADAADAPRRDASARPVRRTGSARPPHADRAAAPGQADSRGPGRRDSGGRSPYPGSDSRPRRARPLSAGGRIARVRRKRST